MTGSRKGTEVEFSHVEDRTERLRRKKGLAGLAEFVRLGQAVQKKADRIAQSGHQSRPKDRA
jgi:hypothetical protein